MTVPRFILMLCLTFPYLLGLTQVPCYSKLIGEGEQAFSNDNYDEAITKFVSARFCWDCPESTPLDSLIQLAQTAWVTALRYSITQAQIMADSIESANIHIDSLYQQEAKARGIIEQQADSLEQAVLLAERQREQALYERYMTQATEAIANQLLVDAQVLTYEAHKLNPDTIYPESKKTFGRLIALTLGDTIYTHSDRLVTMDLMDFGPGIFLRASNREAVFFSDDLLMQRTLTLTEGQHITCFHAIPADQEIVIGCSDGSIFLWSPAKDSSRKVGQMQAAITALAKVNASKNILAASRDHQLSLFTKHDRQNQFASVNAKVYQMLQLHNGNIAGRCSDGTLVIWSKDGNLINKISTGKPYLSSITSGNNGKVLATGSIKGSVSLRSMSGELLRSIPGINPVLKIKFLQNQPAILVGTETQLNIYDFRGNNLRKWMIDKDTLCDFAIDAKEKLLGLFDHKGKVIILDLDTLESVDTLTHQSPVKNIVFHPLGKYILTTTWNGETTLWDNEGNDLLSVDLQTENPINSIFSGDGRYFICATSKRKIIRYPLPEVAFELLKNTYSEETKETEVIQDKYRMQQTKQD